MKDTMMEYVPVRNVPFDAVVKARCVEQICRREHEADYCSGNEHLSVKALCNALAENDE